MARTKRQNGSRSSSTGKGLPNAQFISISLTVDDRAWLQENRSQVAELCNLDTIHDLAERGYKVSFKYEERTRGYLVSIAMPRERGDEMVILTARGSSVPNAFIGLITRLKRYILASSPDATIVTYADTQEGDQAVPENDIW